MTKKLLIVLAAICMLSACNPKPQAPASAATVSSPPSVSDTTTKISESRIASDVTDYFNNLKGFAEAEYTNKNGYTKTVKVFGAAFTNVEILSVNKAADDETYICRSELNNDDWIGTVDITITYHIEKGTAAVFQLKCEKATVDPSYPLNFSDKNIAVLFEDDHFVYRDPDDEATKAFSTMGVGTPVNKDTLQSVEMVEFIGLESNEGYEKYIVELHLTNGSILRGNVSFEYFPSIYRKGRLDHQGIEKWDTMVGEFVKVS